MDEKRELFHEISRWSDTAPEILQSWSRRDLLHILCEEMGKERKYTGMTKSKIIDHLLKSVSENKPTKRRDVSDPESQAPATNNSQQTYKRQRKTDKPSRLPIAVISDSSGDIDKSKYCQNLACRATLHNDDGFCKRCSCCICFQYDDNKDPSLWLVCSSEPPYVGDSCGMSCHLECAIKHGRSGIVKDENNIGLDGSFECIYCGKANDLLSCLRKQLMTAKDTRRVDILCYRISLSQKLLAGTQKYQKLSDIVEAASTKLEAEVGPITGLPAKMARGIVNRLSSGPDIQKLCSSAVETLDSMLSSTIRPIPPNPERARIRFDNVKASSFTVVLGSDKLLAEGITGYTMWHRKANSMNYPPDPTCTLYVPNTRYLLSDLSPDTEYMIKVSSFSDARQVGTFEGSCKTTDVNGISERDQSPTTNSSSLSNPSSEGDESNNITTYDPPKPNNINGLSSKGIEDIPADSVSVLDEERGTWEDCSVHNTNPIMSQLLIDTPKTMNLNHPTKPIEPKAGPLFTTPTKPTRDGTGPSHEEKVTEIGSSTKKKNNARPDEEYIRDDGTFEKEYTYCVKKIRELECDGYIEKNFRLKFLTWYSLRATPEEKRIVKVFVDTFVDDPVSLAGQLVDTFSDDINNKKPQGIFGNGFCTRLFH
ncbi:hypothetical protein ACHQM5_030137 [Ranunculus cassubicifolius]